MEIVSKCQTCVMYCCPNKTDWNFEKEQYVDDDRCLLRKDFERSIILQKLSLWWTNNETLNLFEDLVI